MKMIKMKAVMVVMMMGLGITFGSFVDDICKRTPDYNLCVSLLRSDPRSSTADTVGLGLILIDKIKALGTKTVEQIKYLYKTKPTLKHALDECNRRYSTIFTDVHTASIAIQGDPKFAEDAVVDAGVEAYICQEGLPKGRFPLIDLTQQMQKICDIARAIIRNLL